MPISEGKNLEIACLDDGGKLTDTQRSSCMWPLQSRCHACRHVVTASYHTPAATVSSQTGPSGAPDRPGGIACRDASRTIAQDRITLLDLVYSFGKKEPETKNRDRNVRVSVLPLPLPLTGRSSYCYVTR